VWRREHLQTTRKYPPRNISAYSVADQVQQFLETILEEIWDTGICLPCEIYIYINIYIYTHIHIHTHLKARVAGTCQIATCRLHEGIVRQNINSSLPWTGREPNTSATPTVLLNKRRRSSAHSDKIKATKHNKINWIILWRKAVSWCAKIKFYKEPFHRHAVNIKSRFTAIKLKFFKFTWWWRTFLFISMYKQHGWELNGIKQLPVHSDENLMGGNEL
jgi:hypothetical protein